MIRFAQPRLGPRSPDALRFAPHLLVLAVAVVFGVLAVVGRFPCPTVDDAFYKSPAAELAQHGRLAIPCAIGFLPRMEQVFACYPPVYQLALAAWYSVWGVGLGSSLAFSFFVHAVHSLAIVETTRRLATASLTGQTPTRSDQTLVGVVASCIGLVHLANVVFFDRQEELAMLFVWTLLATRSDAASAWAWRGACAGGAALTSPWVGVLATFAVAASAVLTGPRRTGDRWSARLRTVVSRTGLAAVTTAGAVALWYCVLELSFPGAIEQQFLGILRHLKATQDKGDFWRQATKLCQSMMHSPGQLPTTAIALAGMIWLVVGDFWNRRPACGVAPFVAALLGLVLLAFTRPEAYTYMSAVQMLLAPCAGLAVFRLGASVVDDGALEKRRRRLSLAAVACLVASLLTATRDVAWTGLHAWRLPPQEQADVAFARLRDHVPADARVAVTARHWLAFQGRNEWREAFFSSLESAEEVIACDWLVLEHGRGEPSFLDRFELVDAVAPTVPVDCSYAYKLYRRRRPASQTTSATSPPPSIAARAD